MSESSEFLDLLWGGLQGRAVIALRDAKGAPSIQRFFSWPEQREQLLAYVGKYTEQDVYTSPCLFKGTAGARKSLARAIQVVHGDADEFNVNDALVEPSIVVKTSEGKTHLYWRIEDSHDPALIEPLAHSVSVTHDKAATNYDTGWAVNKLLRVPGTSNTKYDEPFLVTFEDTGRAYTLAEFAAVYPPVESRTAVASLRQMGALPSKGDALRSLKASPQLMQLLNKTTTGNVDPSNGRFLLQNELFRAGATDEAVFVILWDHPFRSDKNENNIWQDILRARAKSEMGDPEEDPGYEPTVTVEPTAKDKSVDFLTLAEKASLGSTFIDDYMAWGMSKTDASPEYHVAAAFTILLHRVLRFRPRGPQVWAAPAQPVVHGAGGDHPFQEVHHPRTRHLNDQGTVRDPRR